MAALALPRPDMIWLVEGVLVELRTGKHGDYASTAVHSLLYVVRCLRTCRGARSTQCVIIPGGFEIEGTQLGALVGPTMMAPEVVT